jgi:hypothetical protein
MVAAGSGCSRLGGKAVSSQKANAVSLQLARFDRLVDNGGVAGRLPPGALFCSMGADMRAAGIEPVEQKAFVFAMVGLHVDEDSARATVAERRRLAPWLDGAKERWSAVLRPYRHKGAVNWLDAASPGPIMELAPPPEAPKPLVVITSVGWNVTPDLDRARIADFGAGVASVRISMSGIDGLAGQHSVFFPGVIATDPITVSFWRDDESVRAFAFAPGPHRRQLDRYRELGTADRTSFTRCTVVESSGSWSGLAPLGL